MRLLFSRYASRVEEAANLVCDSGFWRSVAIVKLDAVGAELVARKLVSAGANKDAVLIPCPTLKESPGEIYTWTNRGVPVCLGMTETAEINAARRYADSTFHLRNRGLKPKADPFL